jgi:hypothetical protein
MKRATDRIGEVLKQISRVDFSFDDQRVEDSVASSWLISEVKGSKYVLEVRLRR